ncbi:CAP domain-containing protein [Phycisphaeraceae bacterium D3-23]
MLLSATVAPAQGPAEEGAGVEPAAGPSAEAVESLVYINALRADPAREAFAIAGLSRRAFDIPAYVAMDLFVDELLAAQPAPPLVFDVRLVDAATKHSEYMIEHGQGHVEDPARAGFTGERHPQRIAAAGYDAWMSCENVFVAALNAHQGHVGFVIDWGWEDHPGGMQPGRGHRANLLNAGLTQVGIAAVPWHEEAFGRDLWSVTHALATPRERRRCVGGVVYADANGNGRFDAGEGRGGVELVGDDGSVATSWDSGAYTLVLIGNDATRVTATGPDGLLCMRFEVAAGVENVQRDWIVPVRVDRDAVARAVEACDAAAAGNEDLQRRARAALWATAEQYAVPEDLAARVEALTQGLGDEVAASRRRVLDALLDSGDDADAVRGVIDAERRAFARTALADWYVQAEAVRRVWVAAARLSADLEPEADPARRRRALRSLYRQLERVTDAELRRAIAPVLRP